MRIYEIIGAAGQRMLAIVEGRDAPLYHMANAVKAESIFRNDTMYATHQHKLPGIGYIFGSSFTRMVRRSAFGSVWLQFDQTKLAQRHKIIPVDGEWAMGYKQDKEEGNRWRDRNSEQFAEEFVVGDINNLHTYITHITLLHTKEYRLLRPNEKEALDQIVSDYAKRWSIPLTMTESDPERLGEAASKPLSPWQFDQDQHGWRSLPSSQQVSAIRSYLQRYALTSNEWRPETPKGGHDILPALLMFHLGQVYANAGNSAAAIKVLAGLLRSGDDQWDNYVQATIAFLNGDQRAFERYAGGENYNEETLARLRQNWGKPYAKAYVGEASLSKLPMIKGGHKMLGEASERLPDGFTDEDGMERFRCQFGSGVVQANFGKRHCAIYEFSANHGGGNGRRTLQWLRQFFDTIDVIDPGDEDSSLLFWQKMRAEGLVDALFDEDYREIT